MPITQSPKGSVVGCQHVQAWLVGTDGYGYGTTGEGASNGSDLHAMLLRYPVSAQLPSPQRVVTALKGGNRFLGQVMFGIDQVGAFPMVLENVDMDFNSLVEDSLQNNTTNSRWRRAAKNDNLPDLPQIGLMLTTIYQDRDEGSDGANLYVNYIIPRCQIQGAYPGMSYQAENTNTFNVSPSFGAREPHGLPLTLMGLRENKALMIALVTPKPIGFTMHISDAAEVVFTTGFLPSSSVVTLNNTPNELMVNGVATALTSINTTTGVATLAAAGAAGAKQGLFYETDFEEIP